MRAIYQEVSTQSKLFEFRKIPYDEKEKLAPWIEE